MSLLDGYMFQPFLRFYFALAKPVTPPFFIFMFQPFLRFYAFLDISSRRGVHSSFQPFLRFYRDVVIENLDFRDVIKFQPFLRFYRSCVRLLWVFKFFFGFLWVRRSAWNNALHSFHSALGESKAPFFSVSRKRKRGGEVGKVRHSSQLAVLWGLFVSRAGLSS